MHLLTQSKNNASALKLKRHLGICYQTAWLMKHKLMEVMRLREDSRAIEGASRSTTLSSAAQAFATA